MILFRFNDKQHQHPPTGDVFGLVAPGFHKHPKHACWRVQEGLGLWFGLICFLWCCLRFFLNILYIYYILYICHYMSLNTFWIL